MRDAARLRRLELIVTAADFTTGDGAVFSVPLAGGDFAAGRERPLVRGRNRRSPARMAAASSLARRISAARAASERPPTTGSRGTAAPASAGRTLDSGSRPSPCSCAAPGRRRGRGGRGLARRRTTRSGVSLAACARTRACIRRNATRFWVRQARPPVVRATSAEPGRWPLRTRAGPSGRRRAAPRASRGPTRFEVARRNHPRKCEVQQSAAESDC